MLKALIFAVVLVLAIYAVATACTLDKGGEIYECWHLTAIPGVGEGHGVYASGGTMALRNVHCVQADSVWKFHGARRELTGEIDPIGNALLRRAYKRWPHLLQHLDDIEALQTTRYTSITGAELQIFGVPTCGSNLTYR